MDPRANLRGICRRRLPESGLDRLEHRGSAHLVVVLTNHVLLRCDVRRGEDLQDRRPIILGLPRESEVLTRESGGRSRRPPSLPPPPRRREGPFWRVRSLLLLSAPVR